MGLALNNLHKQPTNQPSRELNGQLTLHKLSTPQNSHSTQK